MTHTWSKTFAVGLIACALFATGTARADTWVLVAEGTPLTYLRGYQTPAATWPTLSFTPSSDWVQSTPGFGIG